MIKLTLSSLFAPIFAPIFALGLFFAAGHGQVHASGATPPPSNDWSFDGPLGGFDRAQLQRGWTVYKDVCAACHSINQIYYRNLTEIGFSEAQVKKIAANVEVAAGPNEDGDTHEDGDLILRPAKLFDKIIKPYPNEQAARAANGGALPPDLTLMTKANPYGADYVRGLMTGYLEEPPKGVTLQEGMSFNTYFVGNQIAMPNPLSEDAVEYADGTKATVDQMAEDISVFLTWTAEPELEERKRLGIKVLIFLLIFTAMLYAVKRKVWARLGDH